MMKRKRQNTQSGASQGIPFVLEGERGYDQDTLCTCLRHKEHIQRILYFYVCFRLHGSVVYTPGGFSGQRASDPLKLELQTSVSHHVGVGN